MLGTFSYLLYFGRIFDLNYDVVLYDANQVKIGNAFAGDLILDGTTSTTPKGYVNILYNGKNVYIKKLFI